MGKNSVDAFGVFSFAGSLTLLPYDEYDFRLLVFKASRSPQSNQKLYGREALYRPRTLVNDFVTSSKCDAA